MFNQNKREFRELLQAILKTTGFDHYHHRGETLIRHPMKNSSILSEFGEQLAKMADHLTDAVIKDGAFLNPK